MMYVLMLFDWFECMDTTDEDTRLFITRQAWTLTEAQWNHVYECGEICEYEDVDAYEAWPVRQEDENAE
jgi:hypothetical protein